MIFVTSLNIFLCLLCSIKKQLLVNVDSLFESFMQGTTLGTPNSNVCKLCTIYCRSPNFKRVYR